MMTGMQRHPISFLVASIADIMQLSPRKKLQSHPPSAGIPELYQAKLRVGHVHLTPNEVVPLRNTNRSYAWLVRAAVGSHS